MSVDSDDANSFTTGLARLSMILAERNFAIYEVQYHMLAFGSWTLVAGTRHKRLRLSWDGKESYLSVEAATFSSSGAVAAWNAMAEAALELPQGLATPRGVDLVAQFVAQYV